MISDEKRREVAAELRKLADAECIRYAEEFYEELREIVAIDFDGSFEGVANSLADLIDRPTCEDVSVPRGDEFKPYVEFKCSECGCSHVSLTYVYYCPNCGAEVVEGD